MGSCKHLAGTKMRLHSMGFDLFTTELFSQYRHSRRLDMPSVSVATHPHVLTSGTYYPGPQQTSHRQCQRERQAQIIWAL